MAKARRDRHRVGRVILFKRSGSPYWQLKYPVGIRVIRKGRYAGKVKTKYHIESTGQTTLRQAETLANDVNAKLLRGQLGLCTGRITIEELRSTFLEYQRKDTDNRFRHLRDLQGRTGAFLEWSKVRGVPLAKDVTLEIAELFVRHLRHEQRLQDRTIKNYVTAIGSMFAWGQRRQPPLVENNPFATGKNSTLRITAGPSSTQSDEDKYETYTPGQVKELIDQAIAAGDFQIAQIVVVLAETGLRFGELQFLTPDDVDWPRGVIHIRNKKVTASLHPEMSRLLDRHGKWWPKDETNRYVFMAPTCYRVLEQVVLPSSNRPWVFTDQKGLPIQDQGTRERLQRYATEAGIMRYVPDRGKHKGKSWSRANWRMLRNYFVSRAVSAGMSFMHVMAATGHDSYRMVQHYFRLNEDSYRRDFRKFDGGLSGVDLSGREVTQQSNTLGTQSMKNPLSDKGLGTERAGFEPAVQTSRTQPFQGCSLSHSDTSPTIY